MLDRVVIQDNAIPGSWEPEGLRYRGAVAIYTVRSVAGMRRDQGFVRPKRDRKVASFDTEELGYQ